MSNRKVSLVNKTKRNPAELKEASKNLFNNMRYLSERLEFFLRFSNKRNNNELSGMLNSFHDSFLIHSRKMIDFFYNSSQSVYDDDLIAEDFFENPEIWRKLRPVEPEVLKQTKESIGKLLAHLTYRLKENPSGKVTWMTSDIYLGVFNVLQKFLDTVDRNLLDEQIDYLKIDNPNIIICYPVFPPKGKAPYQIASTRDKASGFEIIHGK